MIVKHRSGYTLRQIEGHLVVYVTKPDKTVTKVYNMALTDENIFAIVASIAEKK